MFHLDYPQKILCQLFLSTENYPWIVRLPGGDKWILCHDTAKTEAAKEQEHTLEGTFHKV